MHAHGADDEAVELKTVEQFELMKQAGQVVAGTLALLRSAVRPGITTGELDRIAEESIRSAGAVPSFLGYEGFPGTICASVNDEIVHGIPGYRACCARATWSPSTAARSSRPTPRPCGRARRHPAAGTPTRRSPSASARSPRSSPSCPGSPSRPCGPASPRSRTASRSTTSAPRSTPYARSQGRRYGIIRDYGGHGIGSAMHMAPMVYNYPIRGEKLVLRTGMAIAIEPMLTLGKHKTRLMADDWTVDDQGRLRRRALGAHGGHDPRRRRGHHRPRVGRPRARAHGGGTRRTAPSRGIRVLIVTESCLRTSQTALAHM